MSQPSVAAPITVRNGAMTEPYVPKPWVPVRTSAGHARPPDSPPPVPNPPTPAPTAPPPPQVVRSETMPSSDRLLAAAAATQAQVRTLAEAVRVTERRIQARRGQVKKKTDGQAARDRAIEHVTLAERQEWRELHDRELMHFLNDRAGRPFLAEDFRQWFQDRGLPPPHHHNVWGALWNAAVAQELVVRTGVFRPMQSRSSHGRMTSEWRKA
jgi:hypothetical protein